MCQTLGDLWQYEVWSPHLRRFEQGGPILCAGRAGADGVGEQLAASERNKQAGRRHSVRLALAMGAERGDAPPHSCRKSRDSVRFWEVQLRVVLPWRPPMPFLPSGVNRGIQRDKRNPENKVR